MEFILKNKRVWLGLLGLITIGFGYALSRIQVDFSFDRFYPPDNPEFVFYQEYKELFPHYDNVIQVAFEAPEGDVFEPGFLKRTDSIFKDIEKIAHVDTVIAPSRLEYLRRGPLGLKREPLLDPDDPEKLEKARERVDADSLMYVTFFSTDRKFLSAIVMLDPDILDKAERDTVSNTIGEIAENSGLEHVVAGIPYFRTRYVSKIANELVVFVGLSILLTMFILFLLYRSLWGMLVPQAVVIMALIWCIGFMSATGKAVDMMIDLLPTIMFVVGISDVVHLVTKYIQELEKGKEPKDAMRVTLHQIGMAIFLTSFTTAIGFASLFVSRMPPIREFGLYAAAGVIFAWLIAIVLAPNILLLIPKEKLLRSKGIMRLPVWDRFLQACYRFTLKRQRIVALAFGLLTGLSIWGASMISFNTYLLDDISEEDPIKKSMTFYEDHFYGMRPFEARIEALDGRKVTDLEVLKEMEKIERFMRGQTKMSPFLGPVNFLKAANQLYYGGSSRQFKLPRNAEKVEEFISMAQVENKEALSPIISEDGRFARMSARMGDIGTDSSGHISQRLVQFVADSVQPGVLDYHLTGTAILTEMNVDYLRRNLFSGLLLAFGLIALLMGLLFRSWKMLLVGILPNVIPLLVTAGLMGFFGIALKASTSIIFLVSFGIAVDDTIHFLSRLRLEMREGADTETAIRNTVMGTGRALVLTTLILLSGFILLLYSDFGGTFAVGLFTAATLLVALVSDLLLLPVLVRWSYPDKKKPEKTDLN